MIMNSQFDSPVDIRSQLAAIVHRLFDRKLLNITGGNISVRIGESLIISPRYAGCQRHWQLDPDDLIEGFVQSDALLSDPRFSREGKTHLAIYREFPIVNAVLHAHAFHVLPFAVLSKPIELVIEAIQPFSKVPVVPYALSGSDEFVEQVVDGLRTQATALQEHSAAVILPSHGILVAGKDIWSVVDTLECIDWNAWCLIATKLLGT